MQRKRLSKVDLAQEKRTIFQFCVDHVVWQEAAIITMVEVFSAYKAWRKGYGWVETKLSIDGFGRLFPKNFARKSVWRDGKLLHAVVNVRIK